MIDENQQSAGEWTNTGFRPAASSAGIQGHGSSFETPVVTESGAPVSNAWMKQQGQNQALQAAVAEGYDPGTRTHGNVGGYSVDHDANAWLQAHGLVAVNDRGEEVYPSAAQARGLVHAMMQAEVMGTTSSLSYLDDALHPSIARVRGRRLG
jgi:hypothetical protein